MMNHPAMAGELMRLKNTEFRRAADRYRTTSAVEACAPAPRPPRHARLGVVARRWGCPAFPAP